MPLFVAAARDQLTQATMRYNAAGKPDGTVTTLDTGHAVTNFGSTPISVSGGTLQHFPVGGAQQAGYIQLDAGARLRRVGLTVAWQPSSTGSIAIVVPSAAWSNGVLPNAGIHLVMNGDGTWHCSRWNSGEETYASDATHGRYADVRDGVLRPIDLWIDPDNDTCALFFPDGSFAEFTSPFIGSETAQWAVWELYDLTGASAISARFGELWADTYVPANSAVLLTKPAVFDVRSSVATTTYLSGSGNYTIPLGAVALEVLAQAGGGGAGSGRRGAAGTVRCAGGAGGNGGTTRVTLSVDSVRAAYLSGTVPYSVGAGGTGGAAVTTDDTNGSAGTSGGSTSLGSNGNLALARGGSAGSGGTASTGVSGAMGAGTEAVNASAPSNASTVGNAGGNAVVGASGPGGGITSANVAGAGASGNQALAAFTVSGAGGVVGGASPTAAANPPFLVGCGGTAGGGAASITGAAQAGASSVANSGTGGGGGGASLNGGDSGAGGNGGSGFLRITALF